MKNAIMRYVRGLLILSFFSFSGSAVAQGFSILDGGNTIKIWGTGYNNSSADFADGTFAVEPYWKLVAFPNNYLLTALGTDLYMSSAVPSPWYKSVGSCGTPCLNTPVTVDGDTYRWVTYAKYPNSYGVNALLGSNSSSYFRGPGSSDPAYPSGQPTSGSPSVTNPVINPAQNYNYIIQSKNKFIPTVTGNYVFTSKITADNRIQAYISKPNTATVILNPNTAAPTVDPSTATLLGVNGAENTAGLFGSLATVTNNTVPLVAGQEYEMTYVITDNYVGTGQYGSTGALVASTGFTLSDSIDLSVTITDNRTNYVPGGTLTYVVVVTNRNIRGAVAVPGAKITVNPAVGITFGNWTLSYSGGGSASGTGNITDYVLSTLPVGGTATFSITSSVSGTASGNLTTSATVASSSGYNDIDMSNNTASDLDVLPLVWGGFSARNEGSDVKLTWSTLMEENTLDFQVQRSQTGQPWTEVGKLNAAGSSQTTRNYAYTDKNVPAGVWQYRILQRDIGHFFSTSETRIVNVSGSTDVLTVLGNPVTNGQFRVSVRESGNMTIVDNLGRVVYQAGLTPGTHSIQTSQWTKGAYNYRFTASETVTGRVVLQ